MNEKEFLREKEQLQCVIQKMDNEEKVLEDRLVKTNQSYEKESYVKAHLLYLNNKKLADLRKIKDKPYFARVDFTAKGEEKEKLYIGKLSLMDSETRQPIIIDWRAPISNLYYDGRIGKSSYESPEGTIQGEVSLKRQYFIEDKILKKYSDIDIKTNDEMLQVALEEKASDRLKNIVATIQSEQNDIIRASMDKALIVQGVAGSGKTTIALHRIAYLIYNTEKEFDPENFMIIAPTKFFLNYISNVLPDLGVENVRQYTFEDFAYEVIGKRLKISDKNEKLVTIVNRDFDDINNGNVDLIIEESKFKSSIHFKDVVDNYLRYLEKHFLPEKDFIIENVRIMRRESIQKLFLETYKDLDFYSRINEVRKHVFSKIKSNKSVILDTIDTKRKAKIYKYERDKSLSDEEKRKKRIEVYDETAKVYDMVYDDNIKITDTYFNEIEKHDSTWYYKDFIENYIYKEIKDDKLVDYLVGNTLGNLKRGEIAFEDLAPIIYLHYRIYGTKAKKALRHVIIDEAQDYGEFQFSVLKTILRSNSMTILGDIAQGVHFYRGIENWKRFIDVEFNNSDTLYLTLSKTYRTTKDIMDVANNVIDKLPQYEKQFITKGDPVIVGKDNVFIQKKDNKEKIVESISKDIKEYKENGYKTIAIIGKDIKECKYIKEKLSKVYPDINLIQSKDSEYNGGVSIVPSYLAKGLEFDCVILFNVSENNYKENVLDIKLLYVAITRAMSKLNIYYIDDISKLLK